ncbi:MAG: dihydrolipoyl dehydrogenase [Spirochaeta sp.]|nr:dihydrolipoyl dehydrogenase [Spirochaeta sp.]
MEKAELYDLVIIGSGPGGYVAAIRAAQLGLKACVIEKDEPGGVCLNIGCIPSKALLHQAEIFSSHKELEAMGVKVDVSTLDYSRVLAKSRQAAETLSKGVLYLLKKNKVTLVKGRAEITAPGVVTVDQAQVIKGKNIIIACGSRPRRIPGFDFDQETVLSSNEALLLEELPGEILILGGGAIGCEFAQIMNGFGVKVHLVEMLDHLLPAEDREIVAILERSFRKRGIKTYTATKALSMARTDGRITVALAKQGKAAEQSTDVQVDKVLVVVGRQPNTEKLGLEKLAIELERGFIKVGDYYQTSVPGIFAIGDVVDSPLLAHVASKEGEIVAEYLAGRKPQPAIDPLSIPMAVYTEPQVAAFGLNEEQAAKEGLDYVKASFPFRGVGKAMATGRYEGMVKIISHRESREILGAQIVGPEATELIHELLLARNSELLTADIAAMIHGHPTLSEGVMEAARAVEGWAIHI